MTLMKLRHLADIRNSNVDKVIAEDELPVRLCNYVDVYKNNFITADLEFNAGSATADEIERFQVKKGDVIITKDSEDRHDIGIPAFVRETADDIVCGYHLTMLRAFEKRTYDAFLFWALQSKMAKEALAISANGVTRYGLTQEGIKGLQLWLPDLPAQERIAAFLDRETARIDELIVKKERLIQVVKEKRASALEHLVNAPGSQMTALRRVLFRIEQGWSPECESRMTEGNEWGVLKVGCVNDWQFKPEEHKALPANLPPRPDLEVSKGDILMSRANTPDLVGSVSMVQDAPPRLMLCDKLYRLRFNEALIVPDFAVMFLRSRKARDHYASSSTGASSSMQNISQEIVRTLQIPLPTTEEQKRRVIKFEVLKALLGSLIQKTEISIGHLREYRAALITAAVTGQIDVDTYGKTGATSAALDKIEEGAEA